MASDDPQLNIRLDRAAQQTLEAAAFAKRLTPTALAKEVVVTAIEGFAREKAVKAALESREIEDTRSKGKVTPLEATRRRKKR
jgi:hypothetical protein